MTKRRGGKDEVGAMRHQSFAKPGDEFAKEGIDQVRASDRQHQADEAAAARHQRARRRVGDVAGLARRLRDTLACLQRDLLMPGKRARHRRDRQVEARPQAPSAW